MLKIKRIYEKPEKIDGYRILVDRLWPRGVKKAEAKVDLWLKDIGPSTGLRQWFGHDEKKWEQFKMKYFRELDRKRDLVEMILDYEKNSTVTLLYGSKEPRFNNAVSLMDYIDKMLVSA